MGDEGDDSDGLFSLSLRNGWNEPILPSLHSLHFSERYKMVIRVVTLVTHDVNPFRMEG